MALFLYRLGKFSYRRRWLVISLWLAVLLAVGGSAAAFHGTLSNNFQIPGTETQRIADKLKQELPAASGGTATIVFEAPDGGFTAESRAAVTDALKKLQTVPNVRGTVDPFATQAQVDQAGQAITDGEQQLAAGQAQLDASRAQLDAGAAQLAGAEQQLAAAGAPAALIEAQLGQQKAALAEGQAKLDAGTRELEAGKAKLELGNRQAEASSAIRFVSGDGRAAVAQVQFNTSINGLSPAVREQVQDIAHETSAAGVTAYASKEITEDISELFGAAEVIGIAVAALVLIIMLGTLIAAGLPLLMAVIGVGVGVGITFALSGLFDMSSISPMLALMLGLAVGIDYSLFIVNRHRTQLLAGMGLEESVARATGTSGNAVVFAGLTVIIALAALVVPGLPFLAVMGLAAAGTVAVRRAGGHHPHPGHAVPDRPPDHLEARLGQGRGTQRRTRP
ncbi:putative membrane protein YdfJ with MMPL/SSD domain [Arthrobacter sp. W4I7]|nr:putative membrane protein YdfJ with MMPL/SSD domain [Arthrobacter sp. W4I7]